MASLSQQTPSRFLDLPPELHEHISIYPPSSSISSLIRASRHIQPIYEDILYRRINLHSQSFRSKALLRTFVLRPDLALIVRSLDIDFGWCTAAKDSPGLGMAPDSDRALIDALASAKNIKSLGVSGAAWLRGSELEPIRDGIAKLKLESLRIHECWPHTREQQFRHQQEVFVNLRTLLQGQPLLQDFQFEYFLINREAQSLGDHSLEIQSSHIPNLQTLRADVTTVASILPVAGHRLESLKMVDWNNRKHGKLVESISGLTAARGQIRSLSLLMQWMAHRGWDFDFGKVLDLFPNVESLKIMGGGGFSIHTLRVLWPIYLDRVASQISKSRNLVRLEMPLEFEVEREGTDFGDPQEELLLNLKRSCPSLKTLVTPGRQEWVFLPSEENGSDSFQVVRVGRLYPVSSYFSGGDLEALGSNI